MIQSIIFDKDMFTSKEAKKWLKEHKFKYRKEHVTTDKRRFRQTDPNKFNTYRTQQIRPGIEFILGF